MSHIFGTNTDFNLNEALNFRAENMLAFPTGNEVGRIIMHTGLNNFYGYNGTDWLNLGSAGGVGSYVLPTASTTILGGVKIDGTSITISNGVISSNSEEPAIVSLDEGNGIGYTISGRDSSFYGNLGLGALDVSISDSISSTLGGTGDVTLTSGYANQNSGFAGLVTGWLNTSSSPGGFTGGTQNTNGGFSDFVTGTYNFTAQTTASSNGYKFMSGIRNVSNSGFGNGTLGCGNINNTHSGTVVGQAAETLTGGGNQGSTPMFVVGNGVFNFSSNVLDTTSRSNAFRVFHSGAITGDSLTNALIGSSGAQSLITRNFVFSTVPTTSTSTGVTGQTAVDANYIYKCIATNTWVRGAMATW
tara:strand:- start:3030 stop:4106 length:1077 start_codon:yes stop_codon:yes gene_type:complete